MLVRHTLKKMGGLGVKRFSVDGSVVVASFVVGVLGGLSVFVSADSAKQEERRRQEFEVRYKIVEENTKKLLEELKKKDLK
jgi:hypothetical protein